MTLKEDVQARLYVAAEGFPVKRQYGESEEVLRLLDENGLTARVEIIEVSRLRDFRKITDKEALTGYINSSRIRLPYLACIKSGEMPGVYGYSGLEEITRELSSLGVLQHE